MMKKRGQEEMVGFVLIIIIVAVVFLVLIGIFVRQNASPVDIESREIAQFLESSMEYTSDCMIGKGSEFSEIKNLISECDQGLSCQNLEISACEELNATLSHVLEISWVIGENSLNKGYTFRADTSGNNSRNIIELSEGDCTNSTGFRGAEYITHSFNAELKICG